MVRRGLAPCDFTITLYRSAEDMRAGRQLAQTTGIEWRDTAFTIAARCLAGVDHVLPPAKMARVFGPQVDVILARADSADDLPETRPPAPGHPVVPDPPASGRTGLWRTIFGTK